MKMWLRMGAVIGLCASSGWTFDWTALRPQGSVSDFAGVVDAGAKSQLENYCREIGRSGGVQIQLVTISSLEGEPIEDVAKTIFRAWADLSQGNPDQRIMLLLSVADHRDWLVTGAGLKPGLTSGLSGKV